jgi:hypothetical protein
MSFCWWLDDGSDELACLLALAAAVTWRRCGPSSQPPKLIRVSFCLPTLDIQQPPSYKHYFQLLHQLDLHENQHPNSLSYPIDRLQLARTIINRPNLELHLIHRQTITPLDSLSSF